MSAISHFGNVYAQNAKDLPRYYESIQSGAFATVLGYKMSFDDQLRKYVIMRLMCDLELDKRDVERRFEIHFDEYFADALLKLQEFLPLGLLKIDSDRILVLDYGRFVLRNIAMCFDAYLEKLKKDRPIFSRTV
jgi:oxygen-independent coproporphyrinogen III oxidase